MRNKYAVIVAGGKGTRMENAVPKQYLPLAGKPVLYYSIKAFYTAFDDMQVILVHVSDDTDHIQKIIQYFPHKNIICVKGGDMRFHSVQNGLRKIKEEAVIFVHDGVRPLVSPQLIRACYKQAIKKGSAVPVLPLKESIRKVEGEVNMAVDRALFYTLQTPQTFLSEILLPAFDSPYESAFTDEATVVEKSGHRIHLLEGEDQNIKITRPVDLWLAEKLLLEKGNNDKT